MKGIINNDNTGEVEYATLTAIMWAISHNIVDTLPVVGLAGVVIILTFVVIHLRNINSKPTTRVYMTILYMIAGCWWLLNGNGLLWISSLLMK